MKNRFCAASFQRFSNFASSSRADADGRAPCPECGKVVLLMRLAPNGAIRDRIPKHYPAAQGDA